MSDRASGFKS